MLFVAPFVLVCVKTSLGITEIAPKKIQTNATDTMTQGANVEVINTHGANKHNPNVLTSTIQISKLSGIVACCTTFNGTPKCDA